MQYNTHKAKQNNYKYSLRTKKKKKEVKITLYHVNGILNLSSIDHYRQRNDVHDFFKQSFDMQLNCNPMGENDHFKTDFKSENLLSC